MTYKIRTVEAADYSQLVEIYNYYIEHTTSSFAEAPITIKYFKQLIEEKAPKDIPFLVVEYENQSSDSSKEIIAYAYATYWRERSAYRYSIESSVYVDKQYHGRGIGKMLYQSLLDQIKASEKYHLVIAGITLPNEPSIGLHESLGFRKVAHFSEVGYKFKQWLDVGYWELKLNK